MGDKQFNNAISCKDTLTFNFQVAECLSRYLPMLAPHWQDRIFTKTQINVAQQEKVAGIQC